MTPRQRSAARFLVATAVIVVMAVGGFVAWRLTDRDADVEAPDVASTPELVARGEYLVRMADCAACHNVPGGKPFAGGLAFKLPFGTIYSTNITADEATGIGSWSDDEFVRALHTGVAKGGTHLYPAFPYTSYTGIPRDDAVAIKAYLFSLPKVSAPPRKNDLGFPFNKRWTMAFWNLAFLDQHRFRADPHLSSQENRGAYLATALGHCGECHTPRNIGFALDNGKQFSGAMIEGWHAFNISPDVNAGIGAWSDRQLIDYLTKGHADGRGSASGPMSEAVSNSLQFLRADDAAALVSYLRRVPVQPGEADKKIDAPPVTLAASTPWHPGRTEADGALGQHIFEGACASCHEWTGAGRETPYAALAGSQAVNDPKGTNLVEVLFAGASIQTSQGSAMMPSFAAEYDDAELAAVANYAIAHFGGKTGQVTLEQVKQRRNEHP